MEESKYWKRKIALASVDVDNPKEILKKDKKLVRNLKDENTRLKEDIRKLNNNNKKFIRLVEFMEAKIRKLTEDVKKNYVYSYEKGGWIEKGALDRGDIEIAPSQLSVDSINNQLAEILRMIERNRIK